RQTLGKKPADLHIQGAGDLLQRADGRPADAALELAEITDGLAAALGQHLQGIAARLAQILDLGADPQGGFVGQLGLKRWRCIRCHREYEFLMRHTTEKSALLFYDYEILGLFFYDRFP